MAPLPQNMTLSEFIAWEEFQEFKHEFSDGTVSLFPGGTKRHAALAGEIYAFLLAELRNTPCRAFIMDVLTTTENSARYPDVVVTCDERDTSDMSGRTLEHPKLLVEVLSESTAHVDRGQKLREYTTIDTLEEYFIIDSDRRWAAAYRRANGWAMSSPVSDGSFELASLGVILDLDTLFERAGVPVRE